MNIRRGAVVLHQLDNGPVEVVYAGADATEAERIYRAGDKPGAWALHISRQADRTKKFAAPAESAPTESRKLRRK